MPFPKNKRPSLCGYCLSPGRGFYLEFDKKYYAGCSMDHLEKLRQRLEQGEKLLISASGNPEAVNYAMGQVKKIYKENSDRAGTFTMHEWAQADRDRFFNLFIAHYLTYETEVAKNGMNPGDK